MNEITEEYKRMYEKDMQQIFPDMKKEDHGDLSQLLEEFRQYKGANEND